MDQNNQAITSESENGSEKSKNGNGEQSRLKRRPKRHHQNSDNRKRNSETDKNQ